MNPFKQLKAPCAKCPYKLGLIKTLVNPCPECRLNCYSMYKTFTENKPGKISSSQKES